MFDLDGTLIDSVPDLALAVDRTLLLLALPVAGESRVRGWVGNGAAVLIQRALVFALPNQADAGALQTKALTLFFEQYHQCNAEKTVLYPNVKDTLERLKQQKIIMAIVTNKPKEFVGPILTALDIEHFFDLVLGGDDLENKKPHPQPLLHCMSELAFDSSQTLMVGDSRNDIEAARKADVLVAAVNYGYNHGCPIEAEQPDYVLSDLYQLISKVLT